jgi:hypothetical protein
VAKSITSADIIFVLSVPELGIIGHKLQGFAVDKAFDTDAKTFAETIVGVDGKISAGYIASKGTMHITLQADSDSIDVMNVILEASQTARRVYALSGNITIPAVNRSFTLTKGFIVTGKIVPDAKKMLDPIDYTIDWESMRTSIF